MFNSGFGLKRSSTSRTVLSSHLPVVEDGSFSEDNILEDKSPNTQRTAELTSPSPRKGSIFGDVKKGLSLSKISTEDDPFSPSDFASPRKSIFGDMRKGLSDITKTAKFGQSPSDADSTPVRDDSAVSEALTTDADEDNSGPKKGLDVFRRSMRRSVSGMQHMSKDMKEKLNEIAKNTKDKLNDAKDKFNDALHIVAEEGEEDASTDDDTLEIQEATEDNALTTAGSGISIDGAVVLKDGLELDVFNERCMYDVGVVELYNNATRVQLHAPPAVDRGHLSFIRPTRAPSDFLLSDADDYCV